MQVGATMGVAQAAARATLPPNCRVVVVVRSGDTLAHLAARYQTTWPALRALNRIDDPNRLWPGERLCVLAGPATGTAAAFPSLGRRVRHGARVGLPARIGPPGPAAPIVRGVVDSLMGIPRNDECQGVSRAVAFAHGVGAWAVPAGCFGGIWRPNPYAPQYLVAGRVAPSPGWCNWWPETLRSVDNARAGVAHSAPRVGATVYFPGGDQGASSAGHYGFVEAIGSGGWLLISEMNDSWRAGFGLVNFRFVRADGWLVYYW